MKEMTEIFQIANRFLSSLFVAQKFDEVSSMLHDDCTWIGPCTGEFLISKNTITAYIKDALKNIETCTVINEKCEIATQNKAQVILMLSYYLQYTSSISMEIPTQLNQHCTMVIDKQSGKIVHLNTSNTVESVLKKQNNLKAEFVQHDISSILRLLEEKNEIIQMIDSNPRCGLKGSNDDELFSYYYVNEGLYRMLGYTYDEFMEMSKGSAVGTVYPPDLEKALKDVEKCFKNSEEYSTEYRIQKKDGSFMWVIDSGRKHLNKNGEKQINSILMDITQLKQSQINLQVERERYRIALENITDVMFEYDVVNDDMVKYVKKDNNRNNPVEEVEIKNYMQYLERDHYIHFDDVCRLKSILLDQLNEEQIKIRMYRNSEWRWIEIQCKHIFEDDRLIKCIGIWKDITDEKEKMEQLIDLTQRDPLTKLYHQKAVEDKIQNILNKEDGCALMVMDIDKFKLVNDTLGHSKGNEVLLCVKNILLEECTKCKYVCRIGGDEFMVFLPSNISKHIHEYTNRILNKVNQIRLENMEITISIGITYTHQKENFKDVFARADKAMYEAKRKGRNRVELI